MAFTYLGTLATDRDQVRFYLGDRAKDAGPRPGDQNFSDGEIDGLLTAEGSVNGAVAAGFETLAGEWTRYPSFTADNFSVSRSHIARNFQEQANMWRKKDPGATYGAPGSRPITRADGYSDDKDSVTQ